MYSFTVIDFETANEARSSICQAAIVVVVDGVITDSKTWFIKPKDFYFSPINSFIHGITSDHVKDAPEFPVIWNELADYIVGKTVVAHNVGFDIYALRDVLKLYDIFIPEFHFACTLKESKERFLLPKYTLQNICTHLNIELINHHDAYFDAMACANIAVALKQFYNYRLFPHELSDRSTGSQNPRVIADLTGIQIFDLSSVVNSETLKGKSVVVTGMFNQMTRREIEEYVVKAGANLVGAISNKTALVVMGEAAGPSKIEKVKEINKTKFIPVVDEKEFIETLRALSLY